MSLQLTVPIELFLFHEFNYKHFNFRNQEKMAFKKFPINVADHIALKDLPIDVADLFTASIKGNVWRVKRCIAKSMKYVPVSRRHIKSLDYVNSKDDFDLTPLMHACKLGHFEVVEHLLFSGASAKSTSKDGKTALHYAVQSGNFEVVVTLLQYNADVNGKDNFLMTPLHSACTYGHFEIAKFLCEKGAEINVLTSAKKYTPLHYAGKIKKT